MEDNQRLTERFMFFSNFSLPVNRFKAVVILIVACIFRSIVILLLINTDFQFLPVLRICSMPRVGTQRWRQDAASSDILTTNATE